MKKIILGLLVIFLLIFMYMSLVGDENKGSLTPNLISRIKYLETDSVAGGTFREYGQEAKSVFEKLSSHKDVVTKKDFLKRKFFEESSQRDIEFVLDDGKKIKFKVLFFSMKPYFDEAYVQRIGDDSIYHLNKEEATDIATQFANR
ncbi:hypothetical protein BK749_14310 [Bacillus thuringiensis serovar vazensis]|uniref:Uncharacterized protein n=1 Tax=Bacillus thuringiensis serovar vazensis TaxID=180867 RepID=A0A243CVU7_BACTU|nr:hypothetical protein [Bacillus thuringiensis]EEM86319.1 hypothetical protein bthur0012_56410 [Bacillus thuringiensis serovar pulsiensis BGSC 4CC1]OTY75196.1 hypothetical protein BK749_14310 [Bacillus thuringiensis serovar vazensis]